MLGAGKYIIFEENCYVFFRRGHASFESKPKKVDAIVNEPKKGSSKGFEKLSGVTGYTFSSNRLHTQKFQIFMKNLIPTFCNFHTSKMTLFHEYTLF